MKSTTGRRRLSCSRIPTSRSAASSSTWREDLWFSRKLLGSELVEPWASAPLKEDPDWDFRSSRADTVAEIRTLYVDACDRSRAAAAQVGGLDSPAALPSFGLGPVSLRWIYVHMIEETAQHSGHLDLLSDALRERQPAARATGNAETRLIVIRGNSCSGKTTVARGVQQKQKRKLAVIGQDSIRRDILRSDDRPCNPAIDMIDHFVRYSLDRGLHVVVEGLLTPSKYGDMLRQLVADHRGRTQCYVLNIPFEETLRRHATRVLAEPFGESEMRERYAERSLIPGLDEQIIGPESKASESIARIVADCGWS